MSGSDNAAAAAAAVKDDMAGVTLTKLTLTYESISGSFEIFISFAAPVALCIMLQQQQQQIDEEDAAVNPPSHRMQGSVSASREAEISPSTDHVSPVSPYAPPSAVSSSPIFDDPLRIDVEPSDDQTGNELTLSSSIKHTGSETVLLDKHNYDKVVRQYKKYKGIDA